ncbi:MAG: glycerol-3-phosphate acyltransferase, partial [bacterium]
MYLTQAIVNRRYRDLEVKSVSTSIATIIALIPFYLLGSFPSGYLLAKLHGIDITKQGSGNVGATNVARS